MVDYLNAPVSSVEEGLVRQLLTSEHCTSSKDEKEFVSLYPQFFLDVISLKIQGECPWSKLLISCQMYHDLKMH